MLGHGQRRGLTELVEVLGSGGLQVGLESDAPDEIADSFGVVPNVREVPEFVGSGGVLVDVVVEAAEEEEVVLEEVLEGEEVLGVFVLHLN